MSHLALHEETDEPIRYCRVPDQAGTGRLCKWPDAAIGWAVHATVPGFTEDEFIETAFAVYRRLSEACGIKPTMTQERIARIVLDVRAIDGDSGVLAESELPCGAVKQCHQWYDVGERWLKLGVQQKGVYLYLVILHETMHALGIPHAPQGVRAVIASYYDATLLDLTAYDVEQLQLRYGPPFKPTPPATPTNPTTPSNPEGGSFMGKLLPLLNLLASLGPIIKVIVDLANSGQLAKILEVIKSLGDALGALPPSALKSTQSLVSKDDLKARLQEALAIARMLTAWTPTQADDDLVKSLERVLLTDWVLDILLRVSSYKDEYVAGAAAVAVAQHKMSV